MHDAHLPTEPSEPSEVAGRWQLLRQRVAGLDPRWRLAGAFLLVVAISLLAGLLAGTCWGGAPEPPLEGLGLASPPMENPTDSAEASTGEQTPEEAEETVPLDPEQQAFAERRERELATAQDERDAGSTVPDFTDHALVQELDGTWRLDLGHGSRGYRVRFGTDPVRVVHRQRFDVTLYDAAGSGLPPYFTVFDLPDGKLLAFLDAAGTFQLVLEDVRRESDGRLSWQGPRGARRYGSLLSGESPWRFEDRDRRDPEASAEPESERLEPAEPESSSTPPHLGFRPRPEPVSSGVQAALQEAVERHLDELAYGLMEHDAARVFALWDGRPDDVTRGAVTGIFHRYASLRAWTRLLSVDVVATEEGPQARFEVVVTIQGAPKGARNRRDIELRDVRWRGRIGLDESGRPVELDPFLG